MSYRPPTSNAPAPRYRSVTVTLRTADRIASKTPTQVFIYKRLTITVKETPTFGQLSPFRYGLRFMLDILAKTIGGITDMRRILQLAVAFGLVALFTTPLYAHGGSFRGPNGGVPPGLREPNDPEPPPPPPSDPGDPGGPTTPGDPGPATPTTPDGGHDTPGGAPPPPAPTPSAGPKRKATTKTRTFEYWGYWWTYNNPDIISLKDHILSRGVSSSSPLHFASGRDKENRRNAQRPTERAITKTIIPALLRSLERKGDHEDIHGGCLVALGKIGNSGFINIFEKATFDKWRNQRGVKIEFGSQARESAVLALGLLPNQDKASLDAIRKICLEIIDYPKAGRIKIRTRERVWAAVSLGLQRDKESVRPLLERLGKKYKNQNIPAGLLAGLGLIGDESAVEALAEGFVEGNLSGRRIENDRVRAFIGYALTKIGSPKALTAVLDVLNSRKFGRVVKRSAAIAAGVLASSKKATTDQREEAVRTLMKFIRKGSDPSAKNFAIIALSQIGTDKALAQLLKIADKGRYGQRPFAALGLGTHVFYKERDKAAGKGEGMSDDMMDTIRKAMIKLSAKNKDPDTKAAFLLARGLIKDRAAVDELVSIASKKSGNPTLRGFACVALGLIGDASESVKDAMKLALRERKSVDLRRDAATGLGLLHDADVMRHLIDELKKAKSFAVQGQLITAIGTVGDHNAIDPLVDLLDDKGQPAQTRALAAVGLGMIGDLNRIPRLARLSKNYNYRASVSDLDELLFIL